MTTSELKNCPFCGSEAETHNHASRWYGAKRVTTRDEGWTVRCTNCCLAGSPIQVNDRDDDYGYYATKQEAIAAWNKRAPIEPDAGGWLPIDSAPRDGSFIIGFDPKRNEGGWPPETILWHTWICGDGKSHEGWKVNANFEYLFNPTHWMPQTNQPPTQRRNHGRSNS